MTTKRGLPLNPEATRAAILDAALLNLAQNGPDGVSLSEVARLAGVDRGTAHRHFPSREMLLRETMKLVSDKLYEAVFTDESIQDSSFHSGSEIMKRNERLINFGMANPEICRIWLFETLSCEDPTADPFWQAFAGAYGAFAKTDAAKEDLNTDVLAIIMLASSFLWPIWVRAHAKSEAQRRRLAESFSKECLRLSMYGSLKPAYFPEIERYLKGAAGVVA